MGAPIAHGGAAAWSWAANAAVVARLNACLEAHGNLTPYGSNAREKARTMGIRGRSPYGVDYYEELLKRRPGLRYDVDLYRVELVHEVRHAASDALKELLA